MLFDEAAEVGVGVGAALNDGVTDEAKVVRAVFGWVGAGARVAGPPKMDDTGAWPGVEGCAMIMDHSPNAILSSHISTATKAICSGQFHAELGYWRKQTLSKQPACCEKAMPQNGGSGWGKEVFGLDSSDRLRNTERILGLPILPAGRHRRKLADGLCPLLLPQKKMQGRFAEEGLARG